jgi:phosphoglycolate phosphatase
MAKYKMVLFDSDGTLADTLPWASAAFNQLAERYGFKPVSAAEHEEIRHLSMQELLQRTEIPLWRLPALVTGMRKVMAEHVHEFSLFNGISSSLQQLSQSGVVLGIVSSNSAPTVRTILGPDITALIQHFACSASIFGKAPKLRAVLRASGIAAGDTIYIGDEVRDAEAAHKVGMAYGAVAWGYHDLKTLRAQSAAEYFLKPIEIGQKLT